MNSDFYKIALIQRSLERHRNMSLTVKGVTALLLFTVFFCARPGERLAFIVDIPLTAVMFLLDCHFVKKAGVCRAQLDELSGGPPRGGGRVRVPAVYYACVIVIIAFGLVLFR